MIKITFVFFVISCFLNSLGYVSERNFTLETENMKKILNEDNNLNKTLHFNSTNNISDINLGNSEQIKTEDFDKNNEKLKFEDSQVKEQKTIEKLEKKSEENKKTTKLEKNKAEINQNIKKETDRSDDMGDELDAILHNGDKHAHDREVGKSENEKKDNLEDGEKNNMNIGDEIEKIMHGGESHVHSGKHRSFRPSNSTSLYGTADQESLLHGGDHDVHSKNGAEEKPDSDEQVIGSTDPETILHDGKHHEKNEEEEDDEETGGDSDVATELESLLHGDDGHAHDKPQKEEMSDGKEFVANDPEHLLHGEHGVHDENREVEVDEDDLNSRNLQYSPKNIDGEVGSITKEDFIDYQEWKRTRKVGKKNWISGFSYISDTFRHNIEAIKNRYLSKIFLNKNSSESSKTIHDEA